MAIFPRRFSLPQISSVHTSHRESISMKNLLMIAFFLFAYASADDLDQYLERSKEAYDICGKELGIPSAKTVREMFDNDAKSGEATPSCLRSCVLKKLGLVKDSMLVGESINDFLKEAHAAQPEKLEPLKKVVSDCTEKTKSIADECKMAFSFVDCFLGKN